MSIIANAHPICKGSYAMSYTCGNAKSKTICNRHYTFKTCKHGHPEHSYVQCYWRDGTCRSADGSTPIHHCQAPEQDQDDINNKNAHGKPCTGGGGGGL